MGLKLNEHQLRPSFPKHQNPDMPVNDLEKSEDTSSDTHTFLGFKVKPRPKAQGGGKEIPEKKANVVSRALFSWMTPILMVGYSRPVSTLDSLANLR